MRARRMSARRYRQPSSGGCGTVTAHSSVDNGGGETQIPIAAIAVLIVIGGAYLYTKQA